jgi:ankyrin repeat protein
MKRTILLSLIVALLISTGTSGLVIADQQLNGQLEIAIHNGDLESVKALLDNGVDPNSAEFYNPPLAQAILFRKIPIIQLLLEKGANPNFPGSSGKPPLITALESNWGSPDRLTIIKMLLDSGADMNAKGPTGESALEKGLKSGDKELIQLLSAKKKNEAKPTVPADSK